MAPRTIGINPWLTFFPWTTWLGLMIVAFDVGAVLFFLSMPLAERPGRRYEPVELPYAYEEPDDVLVLDLRMREGEAWIGHHGRRGLPEEEAPLTDQEAWIDRALRPLGLLTEIRARVHVGAGVPPEDMLRLLDALQDRGVRRVTLVR